MVPEWERLAVRALGSKETHLTVRARHRVGPNYLRLQVDDGGLLARSAPYPTMWLRLWFDDAGQTHQRAFTVVEPDPSSGTFSLEFALHDGAAADWARQCQPGERIRASLLGSKPPWEQKKSRRRSGSTSPAGLDADFTGRTVLIGDPAALPAVNAILEAVPQTPVEVWLEHRTPEDRELPVSAGEFHTVHWVHRSGDHDGIAAQLLDHWEQNSPGVEDRYWIAVEAADTRQLNTALHTRYSVPRDHICATAYWRAA